VLSHEAAWRGRSTRFPGAPAPTCDDMHVDASHTVSIAPVPPTSAAGRTALRAYIEDVVSRYYGRPALPDEVRDVLLDNPSDDLVPPHGILLVAQQGGVVVGCAGLRLVHDGLGEITRVFVAPTARGQGLGGHLLDGLEIWARDHGVLVLRLDTRSDLVEARGLYAKHGYVEVEPFNAEEYADHWFAKDLD